MLEFPMVLLGRWRSWTSIQ